MGMLQSRHGGAFAVSALMSQGETAVYEQNRATNKQVVCSSEPKGDHFLDHDCPLEVTLPPEKTAEYQSHTLGLTSENGDVLKRNGRSDDPDCSTTAVDENRQEWMFTLYNFDNNGRVTKEDMSSLMHTIYEVVEASVKQSALNNSKTLRVKLTLTPSYHRADRDAVLSPKRHDQHEENRPSCLRARSPDHPGGSERKLYPVDENTERRNHYLDLAGVENFSSKFETETTDHSPHEESHQAGFNHQLQPDSPGKSGGHGVSFLRSLQPCGKSIRAGGGVGKSSRLHGHHPVSWCSPPQQHQQHPQQHQQHPQQHQQHPQQHQQHPQQHQQHPQQHSHNKRVRARPRSATSPSTTQPGLEWELQPGAGALPGALVPVPQRHEHHHLHEHHHHHHHHHYYSS